MRKSTLPGNLSTVLARLKNNHLYFSNARSKINDNGSEPRGQAAKTGEEMSGGARRRVAARLFEDRLRRRRLNDDA
jgi:hypothetical protein